MQHNRNHCGLSSFLLRYHHCVHLGSVHARLAGRQWGDQETLISHAVSEGSSSVPMRAQAMHLTFQGHGSSPTPLQQNHNCELHQSTLQKAEIQLTDYSIFLNTVQVSPSLNRSSSFSSFSEPFHPHADFCSLSASPGHRYPPVFCRGHATHPQLLGLGHAWSVNAPSHSLQGRNLKHWVPYAHGLHPLSFLLAQEPSDEANNTA